MILPEREVSKLDIDVVSLVQVVLEAWSGGVTITPLGFTAHDKKRFTFIVNVTPMFNEFEPVVINVHKTKRRWKVSYGDINDDNSIPIHFPPVAQRIVNAVKEL